jgi:hypothetical protein
MFIYRDKEVVGVFVRFRASHLLDIRVKKAIGEYFSIGNGQKYKDQLTAKARFNRF